MRDLPTLLTLARTALRSAEARSQHLAGIRAALPPGSSRAKVTSANAKWARAAEERDRCIAEVERLEKELAAASGTWFVMKCKINSWWEFRIERRTGPLSTDFEHMRDDGGALAFNTFQDAEAYISKLATQEVKPSPTAKVATALLLLVALLFAGAARAEEEAYHSVSLTWLAAAAPDDSRIPTHVAVVGTVAYTRNEKDKDLHIRLTEGAAFVIAECIPALPCQRPKKGSRIEVRGISRYDAFHGHAEVHPVLSWRYVQ